MRRHFVAAAVLVLLTAVPVGAKTIKLPEGAPRVMFDVPDDWIVTSTPDGIVTNPPDKSAFIAAGLARRDRKTLLAWQKEATQRMEAFGIAFDPKIKQPEKVAAAPTTLFSGAPSIGTPDQGPRAKTAFDDKVHAGLPLEDLAGRAAPAGVKLRYNALVLYGASYQGTPVDAEFLNYALSAKELFLLQQESGKTDERVGTIIETVRRPEK